MSIFILIIFLVLIIIFLITKIYYLNKSIKNIIPELNNKITNTNNLITTNTNNKNINELVNNLNKSLTKIHALEHEYQNKNQEFNHLFTNISHDLRTPLTAIKGYLELLTKEKNNNKRQEYLNIIQNKTSDLVNLTEELLNFSKSLDVDNKKVPEKICLNNILEEVILSYYPLFKKKT